MSPPTFFNPYEWQRRLLGLKFCEEPSTQRGLILIQIDGLSFPDFQQALKKRHLPFLRYLIRREHYHLWPVYSGIPSNTPSFQGELFFGQFQCVPSFQFRDKTTGKIFTMFYKASAGEIEKRLLEKDKGLIAGGSAYGNILSGGAVESHVCAATDDWVSLLKSWNPYVLLVNSLLCPYAMLRGLLLCLSETFLAFFDFCRGFISGEDLVQEGLFIFTRVLSSIFMREMAATNIKLDIYRGLPVIHVNFFGYDEQAHRRGPSTRFAYWSLSGIDAAVRKIWRAAGRAKRRHYDVWIYSDHGQEKVEPFGKLAGKPIQSAAEEVYGSTGIIATTFGPISQIYFPVPLPDEEKKKFAKNLLEKYPMIPLVILPYAEGKVSYESKDGPFRLPAEAERLLGFDHPYLHEVIQDLDSLSKHESRGDLTLFGWRAGMPAISFSSENGSHAGLGPRETQAFALLPGDVPLQKTLGDRLRAIDLRQAARVTLGKVKLKRSLVPAFGKLPARLRVMSYNVHSCVGMDGILSVERIARIIAKANPDIVALQELDVGRKIKGADQAAAIARELEMHFHFHPVCGTESECFGNAILSHYPIEVVRAELLPQLSKSPLLEPRGVVWAKIDFQGLVLDIFNTHLSFWRPEQELQIQKLLGPDFLGSKDLGEGVILCGDFNVTPGSKFYQRITSLFKEPVISKDYRGSRNTWTSRWPFRRLDYIFMKGNLEAEAVSLAKTQLETRASDHLPVVADFLFNPK